MLNGFEKREHVFSDCNNIIKLKNLRRTTKTLTSKCV